MIRVLGFPTIHPYTKQLDQPPIEYVNPNTDYFELNPEMSSPDTLSILHPIGSYDIVHIHFGYDSIPLERIRALADYFHANSIPIVWTCHNAQSLIERTSPSGSIEEYLYRVSDRVVAPTNGCGSWLEESMGKREDAIKVIKGGYMESPEDVSVWTSGLEKDPKRFIIHLGDLRPNRDLVNYVGAFLQSSDLEEANLRITLKPFGLYDNSKDQPLWERWLLWEMVKREPRVSVLAKPWIESEELVREFFQSHCVVLPYKWATHSGQLKLATDCGCHVVSPDLGFFREQREDGIYWDYTPFMEDQNCGRFVTAAKEALSRPSLTLPGPSRREEVERMRLAHQELYRSLISI